MDGVDIEREDEFCYLGSMASQDGGASRDVASHINKAKEAMTNLEIPTYSHLKKAKNIQLKCQICITV